MPPKRKHVFQKDETHIFCRLLPIVNSYKVISLDNDLFQSLKRSENINDESYSEIDARSFDLGDNFGASGSKWVSNKEIDFNQRLFN